MSENELSARLSALELKLLIVQWLVGPLYLGAVGAIIKLLIDHFAETGM